MGPLGNAFAEIREKYWEIVDFSYKQEEEVIRALPRILTGEIILNGVFPWNDECWRLPTVFKRHS